MESPLDEAVDGPRGQRILALQHGAYGDELQSLGAYKAARSHYLEALEIAQRLESQTAAADDDDVQEPIDDDASALRFHQSLLDNDERYRFERLNLMALIAFDKNRHLASIELFDTLLLADLDPDTKQAFQSKRARSLKMADDQAEIMDLLTIGQTILMPIVRRACDQRHYVFGLLILGAIREACSESGLGGRRLSLLLSADHQSSMQLFLHQIEEMRDEIVIKLGAMVHDLNPFFTRLLDQAEHHVEDLRLLLTHQGPEADREALLRPSVVVDDTIDEKMQNAKQVLLLLSLIQPGSKAVDERLQQLNQLDALRGTIGDRRRGSVAQLIGDRIGRWLQALNPIPCSRFVSAIVTQIIADLIGFCGRASPALLLGAQAIIDPDPILTRFAQQVQHQTAEAGAVRPRFEPVLRQARAMIGAALRGRTLTPDRREALVRRAHALFQAVLARSQASALDLARHQATTGTLQCLQAFEVLRCQREAKQSLGDNHKDRAMKWMIRAAAYGGLDQIEGDVISAASAYIGQIRARANLVAGIDLLEARAAVDCADRAADALISQFMTQAQALDPTDTTILNWAKAFRLRTQGLALISKHEYQRAKAVFEECIDLVDCHVFRDAERMADDLLYKDQLRSAVDRLQIRRRTKDQAPPVMISFSQAGDRTRFVHGILDQLLDGVLDDRDDFDDVLTNVIQAHAIFENADLRAAEIDSFRSCCLARLRPSLHLPMAEIEGIVHEVAADWRSKREWERVSSDEQQRQALVAIVARAVFMAYQQSGVVIDLDSRMFHRLLSAVLDCDQRDVLLDSDDAGDFMGAELASVWRPDHHPPSDYDKIANQVLRSYLRHSESTQTES